ncbi:hypothetical protein CDD82_1817 [Ophiocordyceps australis]|uniref:Uncharacterized protein n=1 Tax=Ophiocordyceps australis TaxID=1399860 RepID=A0A2C5ZEK6_9HYPO|nr:hypothetical protein CDD82_1817 [Ophiocordyceps australis]
MNASSVDCFNFGRWCGNVQQYCYSSECSGDYGRRCSGKKTCWDRYAPGYGNPPAVSTSVHPCSTTASSTRAAATPTPPSRCPRLPTNICKQPSNEALGYGPASPVGNIPLPIVGCSDLRDDYNSRPFKYYSEPDSSNSPSFAWPQWPNVCADACSEQYDQCRATYVQSCRRYSATKRSLSRRIVRQSQQVSKRGAVSLWSGIGSLFGGGVCAPTTDDYSWNNPGADAVNCWGWGGNTPDQAERRCRTQYTDCLEVNKGVSPGGMCQSYCSN